MINPGADSYKELVQNSNIFVDKTLFIKDFIKTEGKVKLITCPRRWCKSMNIQMLKTFFEIEVDADGKAKKKKNKQIISYSIY
jgi:hypothetical protein